MSIQKSFPQLAIINDLQGYSDVKEKNDPNSKTIWRLFDNDVFRCYKEWTNTTSSHIYFFLINDSLKSDSYFKLHNSNIENKEITEQSGFLNCKIQYLYDLEVNLSKDIMEDSLHAFNNIIDLVIRQEKIIKSSQQTPKNSNIKKLTKDNVTLTDLVPDYPHFKIKNISLHFNKLNVPIPDSSYSGLYDPNLKSVTICIKENLLFLVMSLGDGFYTTEAVWVFKENKFLQKFIFGPN
jgi:hypothetical protein